MGCFNTSCGITNLVIEAGDPIVLQLLVEGNGSISSFHPHEDWDAFALPIRGTYNDYGYIENLSEEDMARHALNVDIIGRNVIPNEGEPYDICKPVNAESIKNFKDFGNMIWRGKLFVKAYNKSARIHYAMFHADVYDKLIDSLSKKTKITKMEEFLKFYYQHNQPTSESDQPDKLERIMDGMRSYEFLPDKWAELQSERMGYGASSNAMIGWYFKDHERSFLFKDWLGHGPFAKGVLSLENITTLANGLTEVLNFNHVMRMLRRLYHPVTYCTQEPLNSLERKFGQIHTEKAAKLREKYEEDDDTLDPEEDE